MLLPGLQTPVFKRNNGFDETLTTTGCYQNNPVFLVALRKQKIDFSDDYWLIMNNF